MIDRKCAARGCLKFSRPNGFFCSDACRARTWKQEHPEYQSPPSPKQRQIAAERRNARVSNGGLQVSFWKAVRALGGDPLWLPESIAVRVLTAALPVKQRERLAAAEKPLAGQLDLEGREAA